VQVSAPFTRFGLPRLLAAEPRRQASQLWASFSGFTLHARRLPVWFSLRVLMMELETPGRFRFPPPESGRRFEVGSFSTWQGSHRAMAIKAGRLYVRYRHAFSVWEGCSVVRPSGWCCSGLLIPFVPAVWYLLARGGCPVSLIAEVGPVDSARCHRQGELRSLGFTSDIWLSKSIRFCRVPLWSGRLALCGPIRWCRPSRAIRFPDSTIFCFSKEP
jgi:hypothetical protein